jgi:hypothetical protein
VIRGLRLAVTLATLLALALLAAPPAPGQTEPASTASIELVDRPDWVAAEDEATFLVATAGDVSAASVQVEVFSALDSVEELDESADEDVGVRLSLSPPLGVGFLAPGPDGTQVIGLRVSAEAAGDGETVQIVEPGVHPVVISLLDADGAVLDQIRTPLVRLGDDARDWAAPDLAVLLDVAATPTLQPDGTRAIEPEELQRLAHVGEVLAANPDLDLSVAALPDTVDALGTLPDPAAATLLERLRQRDGLLSLPYLPLPVASLIETGLGGLVAPLVERGEALVADRLAVTPERTVWTGTADLGGEGARLLAELGFDAVVVEPPIVEEPDDAGDLPVLPDSGPVPLEGAGRLLGLVASPVLSAELAGSAGDDADAAHVALARLLLRPVEEDPGDDPDDATVLVRPRELAADSLLSRLLPLLDDPRSPITVGGLGLVDDEVDDDAEVIDPATVPDPDLSEAAARVLATAGQLDSFHALIGIESSRADDLWLQAATAVATTTPRARRDAAMDTVEEVLGTTFGSIRLSGQTDLNLTSRRGTLPLTIENANPFPVDVVVRTRSDRLAFPEGEDMKATVEANDVLRIDVPVEALATGSVPVSVELWTTDDRIRLDARRLNVRSTAVSGVGLVLSFGALAVLVVWWVRNWRRTRRARADGAGAASGTSQDPMG